MGGVSGALGLLCSLFFGFLGGSHLSAWGVIVQKMSMRALRVKWNWTMLLDSSA